MSPPPQKMPRNEAVGTCETPKMARCTSLSPSPQIIRYSEAAGASKTRGIVGPPCQSPAEQPDHSTKKSVLALPLWFLHKSVKNTRSPLHGLSLSTRRPKRARMDAGGLDHSFSERVPSQR
jgi:hypothetical protein